MALEDVYDQMNEQVLEAVADAVAQLVMFSVEAEDGGYINGGRGRSDVNISAMANAGGTPGFNAQGVIAGDGGYGPFSLGSLTTDNRSSTWPDFVGALRLDQDWGFFQVAGAVHDNSAGYYYNPNVIPCSGGAVTLSNVPVRLPV